VFNHIHHEFPSLVTENLDGKRIYNTPSGKRYPSVTTVLQAYNAKAIADWRKRVGTVEANRVSRVATDRGTSVHSAIEKYLKNENGASGNMLPHAKAVYIHMKKVLDDHINNIHCLETQLWSDELELAGTVDCIAEYDGKLNVIDFKTSKRLKKKEQIRNYFMQLAAYSNMFTERTGLYIEEGRIIIGVDNCHFAQILTVNPYDYLPELKVYIQKYRVEQVSKPATLFD
jgi:genome maintenance exonuclease 1